MVVYLVFKKGECVYIGQTKQSLTKRKSKHFCDARKGRGSVFGAAIRKHGEEAFAFVEFIKCSSQECLDRYEKELIAKHKPRYNMQTGGKKDFGAWNKGKKELRPEVLQNISNSAKNRKRTKRGQYSADHKAKIGKTTLERNKKPFICHQTGEVFFNKITCAKKMGINQRSLSVLLSKKTSLKSIKGFTFSYLTSAQDKPTLIDLEAQTQGNKGQEETQPERLTELDLSLNKA